LCDRIEKLEENLYCKDHKWAFLISRRIMTGKHLPVFLIHVGNAKSIA
jgi:hypothetical protein